MSRYYSSVKHRHWQRHYHLGGTETFAGIVNRYVENAVIVVYAGASDLSSSVIQGSPGLTAVRSPAGGLNFTATGLYFDDEDSDGISDTYITTSIADASGDITGVYVQQATLPVAHFTRPQYLGSNDTQLRGYNMTTAPVSRPYYGGTQGASDSISAGFFSLQFAADDHYVNGSFDQTIVGSVWTGTYEHGGSSGSGNLNLDDCTIVAWYYGTGLKAGVNQATAMSEIHNAFATLAS
jgi:hypothetical protein